jgi:hypothetical protein
MKSGMAGVLALGIVAAAQVPLGAQKGREVNGAQYGWLSSLEEGKAQARKTGKPLMVVIRCVP